MCVHYVIIRLLAMCEVKLDLTDVYMSFRIAVSIHVAMGIANGGLQPGKAPAAALGIIQYCMIFLLILRKQHINAQQI